MFIHRTFSAVCIGNNLIRETVFPGLLDVFNNRRNQPQCIIRTCIIDTVHNVRLVCGRDHGRGLKWFLLLLAIIRLKPFRLEQMQSISHGSQSAKQLHDSLLTLLRVGMWNCHRILCRVTISESHTSADLNKGSKS